MYVENKKILNKYWKQLIVPALILLMSVLGITYSYFSLQVTGNDEASSMVVTTASLILNYEDSQEITLSGAYPGASVEKEVKVENIGTVGVTYAIGFVNMENTFQNDELVVSYTCKSYENFGEAGQIESGDCYPLTPQPIDQSEPGIEEGIFIGVGITQVYQIKIEFLETGSAQDYNQDANFSGLINIGETLDAFTLIAQVLYENDAPCSGCDVVVNPDEGGQGGFLLPENGYTVARLSSNIIALNPIRKSRSATTDSEGLFIMPKVAQGMHEIVIKDSSGNLVMSGGIEVTVAPQASVSGTTITGKKGAEEVVILLRAEESTKIIKEMTLLQYPTLTVVMNSGTTSQTFESRYKFGEEITLVEPTRVNYEFDKWTVTGTGSSVVGNTLTMGTEDTTLTASWIVTPYTFAYTGGSQTFTIPETGYYFIELWGAQGGGSQSKGAYVSGNIYLEKNNVIYIYVGQGLNTTGNATSFNGGTGSLGGWPGGGATDIRLVDGTWNDITGLRSRIMIAAGSGAANSNTTLGAGGTLFGISSNETAGGSQLTYGASNYTQSSFGIANGGCTGGNGYYPGGGASCAVGAGGGSSFISGYAGVSAVASSSSTLPTYNTVHYSSKYFINGNMIAGVNPGNGSAKITYVSQTVPTRTNENLNNVRYIKDCINGNNSNNGNHWVELQAIYQGTNVAKNKTITWTNPDHSSYPYTRIVDGDITPDYFAYTESTGLQCITVNLGQVYNLDEIAVWHYWADGRFYYNNTTSVSSDNSNWVTIIDTGNVGETSNGKRINAWD